MPIRLGRLILMYSSKIACHVFILLHCSEAEYPHKSETINRDSDFASLSELQHDCPTSELYKLYMYTGKPEL